MTIKVTLKDSFVERVFYKGKMFRIVEKKFSRLTMKYTYVLTMF
jgi:hypothetical protein